MRTVIAWLFAALFTTTGGWMWANDATVASWIQNQIVEDGDELAPLLGLQTEERWLW